ncbi:hypothetical protein J31TS4_03210 [Paenibacillus sp. J31TS4]|nr:hypothetical protein J31TS4_03210 [Paenibacillus sp. J31TS4]
MHRFNETFLTFVDRDGLQLELVERKEGSRNTRYLGNIPKEKAIKAVGGAILNSPNPENTGNE